MQSSDFQQWTISLALGLAGWLAARRLRIPLPMVLGPMLAVGAGSTLGLVQLAVPTQVRLTLQMIVGVYAGYRIDREAAGQLWHMGPAVAGVTAWTVLSALLIGYLLSLLSGMDLPTALLGTAPGGLPEMSAVALTLHGDVAMVATISATRLIAAMIAMPYLARRALPGRAALALPHAPEASEHAETGSPTTPLSEEGPVDPSALGSTGVLHWAWSVIVGIAGGLVFAVMQIPAAGVMGPMVTVAGARIAGVGLAPPPTWLRTSAQLGIGIVIGTTFSPQTLAVLSGSAIAVLGAAAATVISGLALSGLVQRTLRVDAQTALLACSPAGVIQMVMLAEELGAQTFLVSMFQLTRLTAVVLLMPILFRLLLQ